MRCLFLCRLERELEEKRLKERTELLSKLESLRQETQIEMDQQQTEYKQKLQDLSRKMVLIPFPQSMIINDT